MKVVRSQNLLQWFGVFCLYYLSSTKCDKISAYVQAANSPTDISGKFIYSNRETLNSNSEDQLIFDKVLDENEGRSESVFNNLKGLKTTHESKKPQHLFQKIFGYINKALIPTKPSSKKSHRIGEYSSISLPPEYENNLDEVEDAYLDGDEFVNDIAQGVEESLWVSQKGHSNTSESKRELPVYLFQGQYLAEPRLNRFIDGSIENLVREMKESVLDPIYFRVLPKGRVIGRPKPVVRVGPVKNGVVKQQRRRRRPLRGGIRRQRRRRRPLIGRSYNILEPDSVGTGRQRRRKPINRQQQQLNRKRKKGIFNRGVGGGRVNGLSNMLRDGDAEMQLFGNYTLIRSHFNMGPIQLIMQFRTVRGLRRAMATLDRIRVHTVTRVNTQGCEMMDFLLDKPHAETIQIQDQLFPLAKRVAQNIFSRLFEENSFLVARIREKTGLALLSKKTSY